VLMALGEASSKASMVSVGLPSHVNVYEVPAFLH
jgi:hypothetical protein